MNECAPNGKTPQFAFKDGRFYFTKQGERKVFFFMTIAMLLAGIGVKLGLF